MKKAEKTELTKSKIFAAALKEFGTKGYAAGSVNNICKTGINKGLIYHNFKDKDELYLECVRKSCEDLISYIISRDAKDSFVEYMNARKAFFAEYEEEAYLFLEARTNPPLKLAERIREIYSRFDEMNLAVCKGELSRHKLRKGVSEEEALQFFSEIQKIYNYNFAGRLNGNLSPHEQLTLHEMNIHRVFDFILYGIAEGGEE